MLGEGDAMHGAKRDLDNTHGAGEKRVEKRPNNIPRFD